MSNDRIRLSKFLAVILRHRPHEFDITLDKHGWASLDLVWNTVKSKYGDRYTMDDLHTVVKGDKNGKKRYEIDENQIRALYGHSHIRDIEYESVTPPTVLYHGTNQEATNAIRTEGLQARGRQYVHLTTNRQNAITVAQRRTNDPILLLIRATDAHAAGYIFHQAEAEHYLTRHVPADFIDFPTD